LFSFEKQLYAWIDVTEAADIFQQLIAMLVGQFQYF